MPGTYCNEPLPANPTPKQYKIGTACIDIGARLLIALRSALFHRGGLAIVEAFHIVIGTYSRVQ
jgi:hypothetical protein